jgi:hypothetical protein
MIRERAEPLTELDTKLGRHLVFIQSAVHAPEPFVALARADREGQVTGAKPWMAAPLDIGRWAARPAHEIEVQLLARRLETGRVERADRSRLRRGVDEIIEAIDEPPYSSVAAEELEGSWGSGGHSESYCGATHGAVLTVLRSNVTSQLVALAHATRGFQSVKIPLGLSSNCHT